MPAKTDSKVAVAVMKKAGLKPLVPYANSYSPWKSQCQKCKSIVTPTLRTVKKYGAGCWQCGVEKRINNRRMPEVEAVKKMQKAGLQPLEGYTNNSTPWKYFPLSIGDILPIIILSPFFISIIDSGPSRVPDEITLPPVLGVPFT
jgi:hypothetical protein